MDYDFSSLLIINLKIFIISCEDTGSIKGKIYIIHVSGEKEKQENFNPLSIQNSVHAVLYSVK